MNIRHLLVGLAKLFVCGLAYFVGLIVGGMAAALLQLPQPPMPEGVGQAGAVVAQLVVSPVIALALALIAQRIAGGWLARTLMLSGLTYIAYSLNTMLDASLYMTAYASTSAFTTVSAIVPSLFCGGAVARLFPPQEKGESFVAAWKPFFSRRSVGQWWWRLLLAAVAFVPVYIFFGLLVNPITGDYYRQNMFGLQAPGWDQILPVNFVRSVLFLLACLPICVAWQKSERSLFLTLGFALYVLVGCLVLVAYWLPLSVRIPHSLEILADSFVYAGVLTWLLTGGTPFSERKPSASSTQKLQEGQRRV